MKIFPPNFNPVFLMPSSSVLTPVLKRLCGLARLCEGEVCECKDLSHRNHEVTKVSTCIRRMTFIHPEGRGQATHPEGSQVHEATPHNSAAGIEDGSQRHHHCQEVVILDESLTKALPHGIDVAD